jgi:hypothetical protein
MPNDFGGYNDKMKVEQVKGRLRRGRGRNEAEEVPQILKSFRGLRSLDFS